MNDLRQQIPYGIELKPDKCYRQKHQSVKMSGKFSFSAENLITPYYILKNEG
jgi:hypothetical protein